MIGKLLFKPLAMKQEFRCDCPITSALDIVGDRWILVIVKQMLIEGMSTFKEFSEGEEAVASNILAAKLKCLEGYGLIRKTGHPTNKKTRLYHLTEKGLTLAPLIIELALWGDAQVRPLNPTMQRTDELERMKQDKVQFTQTLVEAYRQQWLT